ncbi:MAG TPA: ComF family protein [Candidatus Krumholzibacteria bacterium]|nr:ComF family protein [Candidatus Krumholzibacteria bacterium]
MPLLAALMSLGSALLDVAAPASCLQCGARPGEAPWSARGPHVPGLRRADEPHLCLACLRGLAGDPRTGTTAGGLPVFAAAATGPLLVDLVGAWKYHGVRGLAWPLAGLLGPAAAALAAGLAAAPVLVPVPLHRRRARGRGFNQAEVLARLAAAERGWPVAPCLVRRRATGQQARLHDDDARRRNLGGAVAVRGGPPAGGPLVLVDDIVTSGATLDEAARALAAAGARPAAALCLGLRAGSG